jgi:hypothetical protein
LIGRLPTYFAHEPFKVTVIKAHVVTAFLPNTNVCIGYKPYTITVISVRSMNRKAAK